MRTSSSPTRSRPGRRALGALAAGLAAVMTITACSASNDAAPTGESGGGALTIYSTGDEVNFDPATSQNLAITTLGLTARRLTAWNTQPGKETELIPDLATDTGTPSDDGQTWTFTLQDGLVFEDGTPITAQTVKYGLERSFSPELTGGLSYHKLLLEGGSDYSGPFDGEHLDSIETPDESTLVFRLNRPYADFDWVASTPAFAPVPETSGTPGEYTKDPVASGPYTVAEYVSGNRVVLTRNDQWDPATDQARTGGPDEITFLLAQDAGVVAQALIADRTDAQNAFAGSFVPVAQLAQAQSAPNVGDRLVTSGPGALEYLTMNTQSEALKDVRVRQALQYAVDKESYRTAKGGEITGDFATTLITPGIPGREEFSLYADDPRGDVDEARRLLHEAGVDDVKLRLVVRQNFQGSAESIQQALARADIDVTIQVLDTAAFDAEVSGGDGSSYDLVLSSWQPDIPSANANLTPLFDSSQIGAGNYNLSRYNNPEVDEAIVKASSELDEASAHAQWAAIDRKILEDSPVVPILYSRNSFLHGSKVSDFEIGTFPAYPNYLRVTVTE